MVLPRTAALSRQGKARPLGELPRQGTGQGSFEETPTHPSCAGPPLLRSCYWKQLLSVGGPLMF